MERPPGEVLPHLCRPLSAPTRCARGALAGSVAPRCARGLLRCARAGPVCAGCGPRCRSLLTPAPGGFPARGGSLRSPPGRLASPPCGRLRPSPRLGRARPSLGGRWPPGLAPAGARGAAARPRSGACCAAPARLALGSGFALVRARCARPPPAAPSLSRSRRAPGPPLRPRRCAAAARCALALAPPAVGPPARRGRAKIARPLGGFAARGASPGVAAAVRGCGGGRFVRLRARGWRLRRWHLKRRPPCPRLERPALALTALLPTYALRGGGHSGPL